MASLKILSDFDGVWTNQGLEAEEIRRWIIEESAKLLEREVEQARADVLAFHERMMAEPHAYGWAPDGERISAYVDEDPLCQPSGLCFFLDNAPGDDVAEYREAIRRGFGSLTKFADHCFMQAMESYRNTHPPAIVSDAHEQLRRVTELGAEVVVVSNSSASKIGAWFRSVGIDAGEGEGHELRLRGSAGKQTLGDTQRSIEIGSRRVCIDRPRYRQAIQEENPDVIIGDVFSLDLALPHVLREEGHAWAPRHLALRRHSHTPSWVLETRGGGAIDHVLENFADLVEAVF